MALFIVGDQPVGDPDTNPIAQTTTLVVAFTVLAQFPKLTKSIKSVITNIVQAIVAAIATVSTTTPIAATFTVLAQIPSNTKAVTKSLFSSVANGISNATKAITKSLISGIGTAVATIITSSSNIIPVAATFSVITQIPSNTKAVTKSLISSVANATSPIKKALTKATLSSLGLVTSTATEVETVITYLIFGFTALVQSSNTKAVTKSLITTLATALSTLTATHIIPQVIISFFPNAVGGAPVGYQIPAKGALAKIFAFIASAHFPSNTKSIIKTVIDAVVTAGLKIHTTFTYTISQFFPPAVGNFPTGFDFPGTSTGSLTYPVYAVFHGLANPTHSVAITKNVISALGIGSSKTNKAITKTSRQIATATNTFIRQFGRFISFVGTTGSSITRQTLVVLNNIGIGSAYIINKSITKASISFVADGILTYLALTGRLYYQAATFVLEASSSISRSISLIRSHIANAFAGIGNKSIFRHITNAASALATSSSVKHAVIALFYGSNVPAVGNIPVGYAPNEIISLTYNVVAVFTGLAGTSTPVKQITNIISVVAQASVTPFKKIMHDLIRFTGSAFLTYSYNVGTAVMQAATFVLEAGSSISKSAGRRLIFVGEATSNIIKSISKFTDFQALGNMLITLAHHAGPAAHVAFNFVADAVFSKNTTVIFDNVKFALQAIGSAIENTITARIFSAIALVTSTRKSQIGVVVNNIASAITSIPQKALTQQFVANAIAAASKSIQVGISRTFVSISSFYYSTAFAYTVILNFIGQSTSNISKSITKALLSGSVLVTQPILLTTRTLMFIFDAIVGGTNSKLIDISRKFILKVSDKANKIIIKVLSMNAFISFSQQLSYLMIAVFQAIAQNQHIRRITKVSIVFVGTFHSTINKVVELFRKFQPFISFGYTTTKGHTYYVIASFAVSSFFSFKSFLHEIHNRKHITSNITKYKNLISNPSIVKGIANIMSWKKLK